MIRKILILPHLKIKMAKCPNCSYTLVLLEYKQKFKCPKCGRLFPQQKIELIEFNKFNKTERIKDKEVIEVDKNKKYKQPKLSEFTKKQDNIVRAKNWRKAHPDYNAEQCRKYLSKNKFKVLSIQRAYHLKYKPQINERRKQLYHENIEYNRLKARLKNWRKEQNALAVLFFENEVIKAYNDSLSSKWLTISLS